MRRHSAIFLAAGAALSACGDAGDSSHATDSADPGVAVENLADLDAPRVDPWQAPAVVPAPAMVYDRFETIGVEDGLPSERVTCVLAEGDDLAVGTERGVAIRTGGKWTVYDEDDGLAHRYVTSVSRQSTTGDLWISTLHGLSRLSAGKIRTWRQTDSGLINDVVYHVLAEGPLVWCATASGMSCLDTRTGGWILHDHTNSIMHEPWCYALAVGPERTWIGVWGGGVVELDRRSGQWKQYLDPDGEMEIDLMREDGPIHDVTASVAYDAGVLWQGTYFGLSRYDGRRWDSYVAADTGFPGDFIAHTAARGHTVWLSTDQGLGVFDGTTCVSYRRNDDGTCDVRTWKDGREVERHTLPTAPAHGYMLWAQAGDHDVWIATAKGLSHGIAAAD